MKRLVRYWYMEWKNMGKSFQHRYLEKQNISFGRKQNSLSINSNKFYAIFCALEWVLILGVQMWLSWSECLCLTPNSHIDILTPESGGVGRWGLWEVWCSRIPLEPTASWGHSKKTPGVNQEEGFPRRHRASVSMLDSSASSAVSHASLLSINLFIGGVCNNVWNGPSQWPTYFSPAISQEPLGQMHWFPYEECHHFPLGGQDTPGPSHFE